MRNASRAAHEIARAGVSSADGSRWRGFDGSSLAGRDGRSRSATRAIGAVKKMKRERERDIEKEMEQHDFARGIEPQSFDPAFDLADDRHQQQAADQLEQKVAERDPARFRRRAQRGQHAQEAAPQVGAEDEAERHRQRDHLERRECGEQQHDGETRVAKHRQERRDQHVEQEIARERREDDLDAGRLDDRSCGDADPLQRENDESEADQDPPEAADGLGLAREEQHDADEDKQRREPRKIERQDDGDE